LVLVAGEITTNAVIEVEHIVRQVVLDVRLRPLDKASTATPAPC
jgi:S-adenosylmethionine synthetase